MKSVTQIWQGNITKRISAPLPNKPAGSSRTPTSFTPALASPLRGDIFEIVGLPRARGSRPMASASGTGSPGGLASLINKKRPSGWDVLCPHGLRLAVVPINRGQRLGSIRKELPGLVVIKPSRGIRRNETVSLAEGKAQAVSTREAEALSLTRPSLAQCEPHLSAGCVNFMVDVAKLANCTLSEKGGTGKPVVALVAIWFTGDQDPKSVATPVVGSSPTVHRTLPQRSGSIGRLFTLYSHLRDYTQACAIGRVNAPKPLCEHGRNLQSGDSLSLVDSRARANSTNQTTSPEGCDKSTMSRKGQTEAGTVFPKAKAQSNCQIGRVQVTMVDRASHLGCSSCACASRKAGQNLRVSLTASYGTALTNRRISLAGDRWTTPHNFPGSNLMTGGSCKMPSCPTNRGSSAWPAERSLITDTLKQASTSNHPEPFYCPSCGAQVGTLEDDIKTCPNCGYELEP